MGAIHLSLIFGGGLLVAVPVLLHLTMRRKPKQLTFPALRFVQQRKQTNQTQLRLRHWMLLLFRTLAVLLLVALMGLANLTAPADFLGSWLTIGVISLLLAHSNSSVRRCVDSSQQSVVYYYFWYLRNAPSGWFGFSHELDSDEWWVIRCSHARRTRCRNFRDRLVASNALHAR